MFHISQIDEASRITLYERKVFQLLLHRFYASAFAKAPLPRMEDQIVPVFFNIIDFGRRYFPDTFPVAEHDLMGIPYFEKTECFFQFGRKIIVTKACQKYVNLD